MPRPKRSLIVMTSHADMGVSGKKTGNWFDEVATLYYEFLAAGSAELSSGWIGTDRSSEWALAVVLKKIEESLSAGRPVAMVCHAPAILRDAKGANRLRFALPDKATADRPRTLHRVAGDGRAGLRRGSLVTRRVQSVHATSPKLKETFR